MRYVYVKTPTPPSVLRLHLNENTAGCSPAVLDALRGITAEAAAFYPDYTDAVAASCERLGVREEQLMLTNGLDEGIMAASVAALKCSPLDAPFEAIVVVPAFDMYAACADAIGGRVVEVPQADFRFPLDAVLERINERTRIVFITSPNHPTGIIVERESILSVARAAPHATIFVDEAYADFSGITLIGDPALDDLPNIVVGRTFAKAYGLAAIRAGALVGAPDTIATLRRMLPPYTLNIAAAVAIPAALRDRERYAWYLSEVRESKRLLYETLERLEIPFWHSDGNFVLARLGDEARRVVDELKKRGVYLRDRSKDRACEGCVRITAGVVAHTRQCIAALEEVLCGAR